MYGIYISYVSLCDTFNMNLIQFTLKSISISESFPESIAALGQMQLKFKFALNSPP